MKIKYEDRLKQKLLAIKINTLVVGIDIAKNYQWARFVDFATNKEMKQLYHYLKTRKENPLKKLQALIVVSKKILTLLYTLAKKKENYDPEKVFGAVRREQLKAAA